MRGWKRTREAETVTAMTQTLQSVLKTVPRNATWNHALPSRFVIVQSVDHKSARLRIEGQA
jgi:hypothetical protein